MLKTLDVVAAIIEKDGNILLAQRPAHADQPGMWEFAGGKVEAGETQPEALIRELREELGIDVPAFRGELTAHYHSALAWCTPEEAFGYALAPADIPLLEAFIVLRDARPAGSC